MKRQATAAQRDAAREKRDALRALSKSLQAARKGGLEPFSQFETVNECLVVIYTKRTGQTDWETFMGWKERGYSVKKGETGAAIWGRPVRLKRRRGDAAAAEPSADSETEWFPVSYLFHAGQVQDVNGNAPSTFVSNAVRSAYEVPPVTSTELAPAPAPLLLMAPAGVVCESAA